MAVLVSLFLSRCASSQMSRLRGGWGKQVGVGVREGVVAATSGTPCREPWSRLHQSHAARARVLACALLHSALYPHWLPFLKSFSWMRKVS